MAVPPQGPMIPVFSANPHHVTNSPNIVHNGSVYCGTAIAVPYIRSKKVRACCKVLQHALSEERKEKSEEKMCPFGTLFELFS